jgi:Uma2 family endonuclease
MLHPIPAYNESCGHNQVIHRAHATIEGPLLDMSTISSPAEQRVILDNISWPTYLAILEDVENRRGRIAYDQGVLEIMSPSKVHEQIKRLIGRIVEAFTEQLQLDVVSAGSTTFKRVDLARGFEPDECYYLQHAQAVRAKDEVDLSVDPPPDLVIEVDISHSSLNKFPIYAALEVPEVWLCDGEHLRICVLQGQEYVESKQSAVLPQLPIDALIHCLGQRRTLDENEIIREFRRRVSG